MDLIAWFFAIACILVFFCTIFKNGFLGALSALVFGGVFFATQDEFTQSLSAIGAVLATCFAVMGFIRESNRN